MLFRTAETRRIVPAMKTMLLAVLVLALTSVASAEPVRATLDLSAVRVEITWVETQAEMKRLRSEHGKAPLDSVIKTELKAFSVLGKRDGDYVCLVFAFRPRSVDDDITTSLGHEIAHCFLGAYH
jgi:hypothetical protein